MMKRLLMVLWISIECVHGVDVDQMIAGWLAHQTNVQTWTADFTQTRHLKTLSQPLISTGRVWFLAPQNFRWEVGGDHTVAIRRDETMLVMYPRWKRAEQYDFNVTQQNQWKDALALLQSGFPRSRRELDAQFEVLKAANTNSLIALEMQPKQAGARKMMPQVNILLTPELTLAGTELMFVDGSRMRTEFRNVKTNADVNGKFELEVPEGFTLVEPMKGRR